jgi:tRNA modification GTPase
VLKEDRAIVTEYPGTTRDVLTEPVSVRGLPVFLSDTAGIRETGDTVERLGVDRTLARAENADLSLWVCDRSAPPAPEDYTVAELLAGKRALALLNKSDLPEAGGWRDGITDGCLAVLDVSAIRGDGLDTLFETVAGLFPSGPASEDGLAGILTRERHRDLLSSSAGQLSEAVAAIGAGLTEDLVSVHLTAACRSLGEILGVGAPDDVIDRIFREFCIGK